MTEQWNDMAHLGRVLVGPGLVFAEDNDVVPDVAWITVERWLRVLDVAGHLTEAHELVIEVLSPGRENERRDLDVKLKLYSRRGVLEYWIIDWQARALSIYRRGAEGLDLVERLTDGTITSPNLSGLAAPMHLLFSGLP